MQQWKSFAAGKSGFGQKPAPLLRIEAGRLGRTIMRDAFRDEMRGNFFSAESEFSEDLLLVGG